MAAWVMAAGSAAAATPQADTPPASSVPAATSALDQGIAAFEAGKETEAVALLTPLAEKGDAEAQTYLGWIYEEPPMAIEPASGRRAPPPFVHDNAQARAWYEKAAAQGEAHAMNNLGSLYFLGRGVPQDPAKGLALFKRAATNGDLQAQKNLAGIYSLGIGTPKDPKESAKWGTEAAQQGDQDALYSLSTVYEAGEGVPKDPVAAYILLNLSHKAGPEADALRARLEQRLSADERQSAHALAADWHAGTPLPLPMQAQGLVQRKRQRRVAFSWRY
ncbi:tetratricopeptide repeat protein [Nitrospirillum sp. BR 11828]|uniref:tetratricopeptide repeat protein n=1 Tax=Nitrospirillum sp. BR 11828 TaxID=3104325 RepID=UPI002ACA6594|nr:tetratricopeptide repeat protein [Nitrospirillum sp. BR 11828]MDZ5646080.1 tetratricopeptide repeat protein [Nitrospirillum sp. BR 11828]